MRDKLRLCASLLIATFGSNPFRPDFWRRFGKAVKLWFGGLKEGGKVSDEIYKQRIAACRQCPISFQKFGLLTCGSPLVKELRHVGCFCDMLTAARYEAMDCWLDENTDLDYGWRRLFPAPKPAHLDSQPSGDNKPPDILSESDRAVHIQGAGKTPDD